MFLDNYRDYESGISYPLIKGRLKSNIDFWRKIGASQFVLDIIENGYAIPFYETPRKAEFSNNASALSHSLFVEESIKELCKLGHVVRMKEKPIVVNPLTVSVNKKGKERLILDLRYVNLYIYKQKVKFENWEAFKQYACDVNYAFSFDLKSGYHHIDIHKDSQSYLGFSWIIDGVQTYFRFTVLAFGLHSSPYIFTKCLKPLVAHWRSKGLKLVLYLDDGICGVNSIEEGIEVSKMVKSDLLQAGLVPNVEKSIWEPQEVIEWLGLTWDLKEGILKLSEEKLVWFKTCLLDTLNKLSRISARELARLTGLIISLTPCLGDITSLMTRFLYYEINASNSWDRKMNVSHNDNLIRELRFWEQNVDSLNGSKRLNDLKLPTDVIGYSDASAYAAGSYIVHSEKNQVVGWCHKMWKEAEINESSTWRELKACWIALASFSKELSGKQVKWFTDNQNVCSIVHKGSKKQRLHELACDIYQLRVIFDIHLDIEWIPRSQNDIADYISKIRDYDDWEVTYDFFKFVDSLLGPFTIDRFANFENRKTVRFNSRFWNPFSEAVDAFTQDWANENNWIVPPICMIARCIRHLQTCRAKGTLIAPEWKSALFWPLLVSYGGQFIPGVRDVYRFPTNNQTIFKSGKYKSIFGSNKLHSAVLVIHLDFI